MIENLTYDDFLQRLNIQTVLQDAGYVLNRRDGLRYPSYVRLDNDGRRIHGDKFIVNAGGWGCFRPPEQKTYNVISLIKENPELFADYKSGMDKDHLVNLVCNRLLNQPMPERKARIIEPNRDIKPFNINDYKTTRYNPSDRRSYLPFSRFFAPRGILEETVRAFAPYVLLCKRKSNSGGIRVSNLCFPLLSPANERGESNGRYIGLEERGRQQADGSSYKGKAPGSNGSEGLWIANLSGEPLSKAKNILWFESAYDAMAAYQLEKHGEQGAKNVYVSTGGNPTVMQIRGMLAVTPNARHYLGFDKDLAGEQFIANFRSIAKDMGLRKDHVIANQPLGQYKDWNDALLDKPNQRLIDKGIPPYDYNMQPVEDNEPQRLCRR